MEKSNLTDEEMIRQYLTEQPNQCFEALYKRYVARVYHRCLFMTKDAQTAQDFTHDIFMKAFSKLDHFQQRSSFATWLTSIAHNYCSDQLRLAKRLHTTSLEDGMDLSESRESGLGEEQLDRVHRAMSGLSASEQLLLRQKYEQGLSIEELAGLYQIKVSAIKMRLKRSRDRVEQLYRQL
ncbi:RNA polymerase sigma factor [Spirosoma sp. KNUC1025]|uniref:RNA polymerase sigma factor n=1 Tax=Spirosoma sp. KNUC1025 TaxID=2894082 RepID=UPI00386FA069